MTPQPDGTTPDAADWLALNRANWDDRVPVHVGSDFYDVDGFRAGASSLRDFELAEVGSVAGRRLLHLQCHFGLDTLSWARLGAHVTGLDFSAPAIDTARRLATEVHLAARFVVSDVYAAADALDGETFDLVYTGIGALYWLPDLDRWASVVASLLRPGGALYLAEFHPFTDVFGPDGRTVALDYFRAGPELWDEPAATYTDGVLATEHNATVGWAHTMGETLTAIARAGLRLEFLHEHDTTLFARYPVLERVGRHEFGYPAGSPRLPLMYSLRAVRT